MFELSIDEAKAKYKSAEEKYPVPLFDPLELLKQ